MYLQTSTSVPEKTVGLRPPNRKFHYTNNPLVVEMAAEKQKLRIEMEGHDRISYTKKYLRQQINQIGRDIKKRLKKLECESADRLAEEISSVINR
jgi:hypothetical protein